MGGRLAGLTSLLWLAACTRLGFTPPSVDPDAMPGDAVVVDARQVADHLLDGPHVDGPSIDGLPDAPTLDVLAPDGPLLDAPSPDQGGPLACGWTGSFTLSAPVNLTALNSSVEDGNPFITADGLTLFFESKRPGGAGVEDIWYATRPSVGAAWGAPAAYTGLNTSLSDSAFTVTADGLTGFLSTNRAGGTGGLDIWIVTRASASQPFFNTAAVPLSVVNDAAHQWDPMPAAGGLELYISSNDYPQALGGQGGADIVVSTRSSASDPFGVPAPVPGINSSSSEANPSLTADRRVMLFGSNRPGGSGSLDIWYATRSGPGAPFSAPKPAPGINTLDYDGEPFVTPDGCELYFASSRAGGLGGWDLYRSSYAASP